MGVVGGMHRHICPVCEKEFYCYTEHVYKRRDPRHKTCKDKTVYFCSWTCFRIDEKNLEARKKKKVDEIA